MVGYTPCAVPGCDDRISSRHRFPSPVKDKERYEKWIEVISNPKLVAMDPMRVYRSYRVCHQHFTINDKSSNMFLKCTTVPSQHLPSNTETCPSTSTIVIQQPLDETNIPLSRQPLSPQRCATPTDIQCISKTLLQELGITKCADLTPKAKLLYTKVKTLQSTVLIYRKRIAAMNAKLRLATETLYSSESGLGVETFKFCVQKLMRKSRNGNGTRYTSEEKMMCLALYKASGSAYPLLSKWFSLPCPRTMSRLLQNIPIFPGINEFVFTNLKMCVEKMKLKDKLCCVMFDEIALQPHVEYKKYEDTLIGVENGLMLDHALVFMVKGIVTNWKQVVAFDFCKGTTKSDVIQAMLTNVIKKLQETGLNVIATICDQGATNRRAIKDLIQNSRQYFIKRNRGPRRSIDEKDVFVGKWQDIITAYEIDNTSGDIRCLPKITEGHVRTNKMKKMKVSYATQVFSRSMAAAISIMARNEEADVTGAYKMNKTAHGTAKILSFFDKLFDSLNSAEKKSDPYKYLTFAVTEKSGHISFWQRALSSLRNMYFQEEGKTEKNVPPSLTNLIYTIEGFIHITKRIFDMKIRQVYTRKLNQDPLEIFFGQIRQHRGRLTNPTCTQFIQSYKSLFLRSLSGRHSIMANCEQTCETSIIQLENCKNMGSKYISKTIHEEPRIHKELQKIIKKQVNPRVMMYLLQHLKLIIGKQLECGLCKIHILKDHRQTEYPTNSVEMYNTFFIDCLRIIYNITNYILEKENILYNIKETILLYVNRYVFFSFMCSDKHIICNSIKNKIIIVCILQACKKMNDVVKGKRIIQYTSQMSDVMKEAVTIREKRKHTNK